MRIVFDPTGTPAGLVETCHRLQSEAGIEGLLILACNANGFKPENLDSHLRTLQLPVFGGVFPELIHGRNKHERGTLVAGLTVRPDLIIVPRLSDPDVDYDNILDQYDASSASAQTGFVFVDGFARRISALIDSLFNVFGLEFNYIGGGAGSLDMRQKPCLITNDGLAMDRAVLALLDVPSGVGVSHGWRDIAGPFVVSESDHNVIRSIDGVTAFAFYQNIIKTHSGLEITPDNFFDLAKSYPLGISRLGEEKLVRDPVKVDREGSVYCVGEVPQGVYLHVLTGEASSLVSAAGRAVAAARDNFTGDPEGQPIFFIDCISRVLFLKDRFQEELESVYDPNAPVFGALTIGEIANSGRDYLEFYNKTSVVGVLGGL